MRVRVSGRAIRALFEYKSLLNPFRTGLFSWQLLSHKWMRYFSFVPLAGVVVLSFFHLGDSLFANLLVVLEVLFIALACLAWLFPSIAARSSVSRWCMYFLLLNLASANAFLQVLVGNSFTTWQPWKG